MVNGTPQIDHTTDVLLAGQSVARSFDSRGVNYDKTYFSGPRGPECEVGSTAQGATTVQWYVYDGLGSVVATVDSTGSYTSLRRYDVYGKATDLVTNTSNTKHQFVGGLGHPSEDETGGLIYMRARYMDPAVGRFISEDPAGSGMNWFVYCGNNPVGFVDQTGNHQSPAEKLFEEMMAAADELVREANRHEALAARKFAEAEWSKKWALACEDEIGRETLELGYAVLMKSAVRDNGFAIAKYFGAEMLRDMAYLMMIGYYE